MTKAERHYLIERLGGVVHLLRSDKPECRHMAAAKLLADISALKEESEPNLTTNTDKAGS